MENLKCRTFQRHFTIYFQGHCKNQINDCQWICENTLMFPPHPLLSNKSEKYLEQREQGADSEKLINCSTSHSQEVSVPNQIHKFSDSQMIRHTFLIKSISKLCVIKLLKYHLKEPLH